PHSELSSTVLTQQTYPPPSLTPVAPSPPFFFSMLPRPPRSTLFPYTTLFRSLLSTIPMEANLYRAVRAMVPSVKAVRVPGPFTCYVSIEQRLPGQAKNAILSVLGADLYMKRVVVVDQDVDIFDDRQVTWAIATRCQPDRDISIITHARGSDLDPSTKEDGYTAKWGVDATAKPSLAGYTPRHRVPSDAWKRINLKDFGLQ